MKTKSIIKSLMVVMTLVLTQCTSDLAKLNVNPTAVTGDLYDPNYLLTTCELEYTGSADFSYETWRVQLIYLSTMMQHLSNLNSYWAGNYYKFNQAYSESYFTCAYAGEDGIGQIRNVIPLLALTKDKPEHANLYQIGRIMRVIMFHRVTDLYGDVPYFDAGQGYYQSNLTPKYDKQSDIYPDMLKELDEAATALDPTKDVTTGDMIYQGDVTKWKKLAYSMMLRLGTRLSKIDPANSKIWIEKAAAGGVFTSINDNALVKGDPAFGREATNRISQVLNLSYEIPYIRWSKTYIDFLKSTNDPRLSAVAELPPHNLSNNTLGAVGDNTPANQVGMPNGLDFTGIHNATDVRNEPNYPDSVLVAPNTYDYCGNYSRPINSIYAKANGPTFIITYAETELLLAEAALNNYTVTGTAASHYNNGVTAAMAQLAQFDPAATVDPTAISNYLTANPYVPANGLQMINEQYWAATIFNDYETFANWRRTGIPTLTPVNYTGNVTNGTIPRRMVYVQAEAAYNSANYNAAVAALAGVGGNTLMGRVWWDN